MKDRIKEFIENNKLNFNASGSGLNSSCVIISGYALFLDAINPQAIKEAVGELFPEAVGNFEKELERVFDYCDNNLYGRYWETAEAKLMYKF